MTDGKWIENYIPRSTGKHASSLQAVLNLTTPLVFKIWPID